MFYHIKRSIFAQLLLVIAGTSILTALLSGLGHNLFASRLIDKSIKNQASTALQLSSDYLENNYTKTISDDLKILRISPAVNSLLTANPPEAQEHQLDVEQFLISLVRNRHSIYQSARLINKLDQEMAVIKDGKTLDGGNILTSPPTPINLRISELFFQLKNSSETIIFSRPALYDEQQLFLAGTAIWDMQGNFIGAAIITFTIGDFIEYLKNFKVFDQSIIWLFTHHGTPIFEVDEKNAINPSAFVFNGKKAPKELLIYASDKKAHSSISSILRIVISVSPQIYKNLRKDSLAITLLILIFITATACLIAYFTARKIVQPIRQLTEQSQKVAAGDFSVTMNAQGKNEISLLAFAFNIMVKELDEQHHELQSLAHRDTLTQLPNRRQFEEHLSSCIRNCKKTNSKLAVIYIDLDQFKDTNDTLGHPAGDKLICGVAKRLSGTVRQTDLVARLGGDEFAIIINPHKTRTDTEHIAKKILQELNKSFSIDGHQVFSGGSIGISIYPDHGDDAITVVKNADAAMYKAKNMGRNSYQFYSKNLTEQANERVVLGGLIRKALENQEFDIHFQPKLSLDNERVIGAEALFRWQQHSESISPVKVFDVAESTGLVEKLDEWIINHVFKQLKTWSDEFNLNIPISVNISGRLLERNLIADILRKAFETHTIDPQLIEIEITENHLISDFKQTQKNLEIIHDLGVKVAIDDFGTGYSSLSYLKDMKADTLKIDRKFVVNAMTNDADKEIASAIVNLARSLDMHVVVEGIESKDQAVFFKRLGAHSAQGYLYASPMPKDAFLEYLNQHSSRRSRGNVIKL